ncbi:hypothetical protein DICVIV_13477 [Dictyocaulus viviparus]|uniref:Uncharacterized protein n=1 Tax=Dictyocaulus viviparus TaxID=29172 RepID=A0A0D8XA98_DICVI|nr:hypothetical protein DICVIV_13477 [Dictyocaulus viviparus]
MLHTLVVCDFTPSPTYGDSSYRLLSKVDTDEMMQSITVEFHYDNEDERNETKMRTFWGSKDKPFTLSCLLPTPENNNFSLEWRKDDKLILSAFGAEAGHVAPALQAILPVGAALCALIARPELF